MSYSQNTRSVPRMRNLTYTERNEFENTVRECGNAYARTEGKVFSEKGVREVLNYAYASTQRMKFKSITEFARAKFKSFANCYDIGDYYEDETPVVVVDEPNNEPTTNANANVIDPTQAQTQTNQTEPSNTPSDEPSDEPSKDDEGDEEDDEEDEDEEDEDEEDEEDEDDPLEPLVQYIKAQVMDEVDEKIKAIEPQVKTSVIEVKTPNQSKKVEGFVHKEFETVLNYVSADEPVYLYGPAGAGKNVLCKQVADALGLDFYFTNAVTQEHKLTGFIDAMGVYHETEFYKAFTRGGLFMLDEMDASIPEALIILNGAIANRYFDFPTGRVDAHPDFRVIGAGNTCGRGATYQYNGRSQLDGASLDRFAMVNIDYDQDIELGCAGGDKELVNFVHAFRTASEKAGMSIILSYRGINRLSKMCPLIGLEKALIGGIVRGMDQADLDAICANMRCDNEYATALRSIRVSA